MKVKKQLFKTYVYRITYRISFKNSEQVFVGSKTIKSYNEEKDLNFDNIIRQNLKKWGDIKFGGIIMVESLGTLPDAQK
ncbi:MAG: hypothetical protein RBS86_04840 [Candidatus Moranbacteria bacterium]|jgi:hypothetical protein|nr:hypothetical protein [Candidatus Moranbacteria bacterium]